MITETKAISEQSLIDIAVQQCGSATAVFELAVLNGISITDDLSVGQIIERSTVVDEDIAKYYRNRNLKPTTALSSEDKEIASRPEGIGYWAINEDFIVQ